MKKSINALFKILAVVYNEVIYKICVELRNMPWNMFGPKMIILTKMI